LPTVYQLKGSILKKLNDKSQIFINRRLSECESVTIEIDGWENIRHFSVLNIMLCIPESIFYKSVEVVGESVDNKVVQREVENVISTISSEKVSAIVTDNGSPMIKAHEELQKKYPHLVSVRCSAHVLNLLIEDICRFETIHKFLTKSKSIIKEINGKKLKKGYYSQEIQKYKTEEMSKGRKVTARALKLPIATRWYSVQNMLSLLRSAKPILERMAINKDYDLSPGLKKIIKNDKFWDQLVSFNEFLKPFIKG